MPKANVEFRYERCGYIYTDRTRMMFAPRFTITRRSEDSGIVICATRNYPEPIKQDINKCLAAISEKFPDDAIFCDTPNGLVALK